MCSHMPRTCRRCQLSLVSRHTSQTQSYGGWRAWAAAVHRRLHIPWNYHISTAIVCIWYGCQTATRYVRGCVQWPWLSHSARTVCSTSSTWQVLVVSLYDVSMTHASQAKQPTQGKANNYQGSKTQALAQTQTQALIKAGTDHPCV